MARSLHQPSFKMSNAQLGMIVLLVSLGMLFAGTLVAYLVTRANNATWRTAALPPLPLGLAASTLLIVGVSASHHHALACVRKNRLDSLQHSLWLTLAFALAFLGGQALNWQHMAAVPLEEASRTLYLFTFFLLTGVHALHVLGGFVPLGVVLAKARAREYTSSHHEGVKLSAQYWDFLGVVWLCLLTALYLAT